MNTDKLTYMLKNDIKKQKTTSKSNNNFKLETEDIFNTVYKDNYKNTSKKTTKLDSKVNSDADLIETYNIKSKTKKVEKVTTDVKKEIKSEPELKNTSKIETKNTIEPIVESSLQNVSRQEIKPSTTQEIKEDRSYTINLSGNIKKIDSSTSTPAISKETLQNYYFPRIFILDNIEYIYDPYATEDLDLSEVLYDKVDETIIYRNNLENVPIDIKFELVVTEDETSQIITEKITFPDDDFYKLIQNEFTLDKIPNYLLTLLKSLTETNKVSTFIKILDYLKTYKYKQLKSTLKLSLSSIPLFIIQKIMNIYEYKTEEDKQKIIETALNFIQDRNKIILTTKGYWKPITESLYCYPDLETETGQLLYRSLLYKYTTKEDVKLKELDEYFEYVWEKYITYSFYDNYDEALKIDTKKYEEYKKTLLLYEDSDINLLNITEQLQAFNNGYYFEFMDNTNKHSINISYDSNVETQLSNDVKVVPLFEFEYTVNKLKVFSLMLSLNQRRKYSQLFINPKKDSTIMDGYRYYLRGSFGNSAILKKYNIKIPNETEIKHIFSNLVKDNFYEVKDLKLDFTILFAFLFKCIDINLTTYNICDCLKIKDSKFDLTIIDILDKFEYPIVNVEVLKQMDPFYKVKTILDIIHLQDGDYTLQKTITISTNGVEDMQVKILKNDSNKELNSNIKLKDNIESYLEDSEFCTPTETAKLNKDYYMKLCSDGSEVDKTTFDFSTFLSSTLNAFQSVIPEIGNYLKENIRTFVSGFGTIPLLIYDVTSIVAQLIF